MQAWVAQARTPAITHFPFHHTCVAGNSRNDIGTEKFQPGELIIHSVYDREGMTSFAEHAPLISEAICSIH